MKTDYPELEGKEVRFVGYREVIFLEAEPFECVAIVAGCNYHVGITFVQKDNNENELVCLNKKIHAEKFSPKIYRKIFYDIINRIHEGIYIVDDVALFRDSICNYSGRFGGMADCAFK